MTIGSDICCFTVGEEPAAEEDGNEAGFSAFSGKGFTLNGSVVENTEPSPFGLKAERKS